MSKKKNLKGWAPGLHYDDAILKFILQVCFTFWNRVRKWAFVSQVKFFNYKISFRGNES